MSGEQVPLGAAGRLPSDDEPYTCQGCGAVRYGSHWRDRAHNCWRNEDGSYEEGGTFQ
jgi:hypothetical protein